MLPENPCRYDELRDGTLMRKEGSKQFRIYCEDAGEFPIRVITPGFCMALSEAGLMLPKGKGKGYPLTEQRPPP